MATENEIAPPIDIHFNNAVNTIQMTPEELQQVKQASLSHTANFNNVVGQQYGIQAPQANINAAPGQPDKAGIQTDHPLQYGLENVDYNFKEVQTVGILGDCMGAMGKLCDDVKAGHQPPPPANKPEPPQQDANINHKPVVEEKVADMALAPEDKVYNFTPSPGPSGMAM